MPVLDLDVIVLLAEGLACDGSRGTLASLALCSRHTCDAVFPALYRFLHLKRGAHVRALYLALRGARGVRYGRCIKQMSVDPRAVKYLVAHWNKQVFGSIHITLENITVVLDSHEACRFFAAIIPTTVRRLKIAPCECERFPSKPIIMAARSHMRDTIQELVIVGMRGSSRPSEQRVTPAHVQAFTSLTSVTILYKPLDYDGNTRQLQQDVLCTILSFIQLRTLERFQLLLYGVTWTGNAPAPPGTLTFDFWLRHGLRRGSRTWSFVNALLPMIQGNPRYTIGFIDAQTVRLITDGGAVDESIDESAARTSTSLDVLFFGTPPSP